MSDIEFARFLFGTFLCIALPLAICAGIMLWSNAKYGGGMSGIGIPPCPLPPPRKK